MKVSKLKALLANADDSWVVDLDDDNDLVFHTSELASNDGEFELAYISLVMEVYRKRNEEGKYV